MSLYMNDKVIETLLEDLSEEAIVELSDNKGGDE